MCDVRRASSPSVLVLLWVILTICWLIEHNFCRQHRGQAELEDHHRGCVQERELFQYVQQNPGGFLSGSYGEHSVCWLTAGVCWLTSHRKAGSVIGCQMVARPSLNKLLGIIDILGHPLDHLLSTHWFSSQPHVNTLYNKICLSGEELSALSLIFYFLLKIQLWLLWL